MITKEPTVDAFAAKLLSLPDFQNGTLKLYANVPVKCIRYTQPYHICSSNPCSDPDRYAHVVMDFVVCHEDSAILCICFDEHRLQHNTMFKTYLHGMDYVRHSIHRLEEGELEKLYDRVLEKLHFFTHYQLTSVNYALVPVEIQSSVQELQSKRLLCDDPMSRFYTRDCGLFFHCTLTDEGAVARQVLTSDAMAAAFSEVLNWKPEENYCTDDLRNLLDMPLEEFFRMRPDSLHFLGQNLAVAKRRLEHPADKTIDTYGDCLGVLLEIRDRVQNPETDARERNWLENTNKSILLALCEIVSKWYIPLFQLPMLHYFTAAANLAGYYYPIWLYRNRIFPHLCNRPKDCFATSEFANTCMPCIMARDQPAVPYILSELMCAPVCRMADL